MYYILHKTWIFFLKPKKIYKKENFQIQNYKQKYVVFIPPPSPAAAAIIAREVKENTLNGMTIGKINMLYLYMCDYMNSNNTNRI